MKKLTCLLALVLLLSACASSGQSVTLEDGDEVVVTGDKMELTKNDLLAYFLDNYGASYVLSDALNTIANNYEVDDETFQTALDERLSSYEMMGMDLDEYAEQYLGYDSFAAYQSEVLEPNVRLELMFKNYISEHFDELAADHDFRKLRMIVVADQQTAMTVLGEINTEEKTFEEAAKEYSTDTASKDNGGDIGVVSDLSTGSVDDAIIRLLSGLTAVSLYSTPVALDSGSYAVLDVVETELENMKDEALETLQNSEVINQQVQAHFLKENQFTVYESTVKENIKAQYPDFIGD